MGAVVNADPREAVVAAAQALVRARRSGRRVEAAAVALPDAQSAYAVQEAVAAALDWVAAGTPGTWKVGVTKGPERRTHARLPAVGVWASPASAADWPLHSIGIEAELAFRLARDVAAEQAAGLDAGAALDWVDAIAAAIEVVDSRWAEGLAAPAPNLLADLQSHGALVLGDWVPLAPCDWSAQACRVRIGARPRLERIGSHALVDPTVLLVDWMRHATRKGATLPAGSVVTTGSWVGILDAVRGERVEVDFPGIGVASLQL